MQRCLAQRSDGFLCHRWCFRMEKICKLGHDDFVVERPPTQPESEEDCDVLAMISGVWLRLLHEFGSGLCTATRDKVIAAIFTSSQ